MKVFAEISAIYWVAAGILMVLMSALLSDKIEEALRAILGVGSCPDERGTWKSREERNLISLLSATGWSVALVAWVLGLVAFGLFAHIVAGALVVVLSTPVLWVVVIRSVYPRIHEEKFLARLKEGMQGKYVSATPK